MTASPRECARDAEISRARLDLVIDRLEQRLTPLGLADEAVGLMRRSAAMPVVEKGLETARRNPLPVLLIAAGAGLLAWRLLRDRDEPQRLPAAGNGNAEPVPVPAQDTRGQTPRHVQTRDLQ